MSNSVSDSVSPLVARDFTRANGITPAIEAAIDQAFNDQPWSEEMVARGKRVREALATAVKVIVDCVPASPDRSAAIRKLREARMDANSAITHNGRY